MEYAGTNPPIFNKFFFYILSRMTVTRWFLLCVVFLFALQYLLFLHEEFDLHNMFEYINKDK